MSRGRRGAGLDGLTSGLRRSGLNDGKGGAFRYSRLHACPIAALDSSFAPQTHPKPPR